MARSFRGLAARLRFSRRYGIATSVVLAVEIAIALFVRDDFVRPYLGDTLAVVLLYCAVLAVLELPRSRVALGALGVALLVELGQAFALVDRIGLGAIPAARVILGTYCDPRDALAYAAALPLLALSDRDAWCGSRAQRAFRSLLRFSKTRRPRLG